MSAHTISLTVLTATSVVLSALPAFGASRACPPLVVEADDEVLGLWPELPEHVHGTLAAQEGIDPCARVSLGMRESAIEVEVILADGRSATRSVPQREDVVPMIEALLLVPRAASKTTDSASSRSEPTTQPEEAPPPEPTLERAEPSSPPSPLVPERPIIDAPPESSEDRRGIELSLVTRARIGEHQTASLGIGALSFLELSGWLLGFEARVDEYDTANTVPRTMLAIGALGGRRFRSDSVSLDLIIGPTLALHSEENVDIGPERKRVSSLEAVPRLFFGSHLNFAALSLFRGFVGIEGDAGARGGSTGVEFSGSPPMPAWTLGLALGATVGTR